MTPPRVPCAARRGGESAAQQCAAPARRRRLGRSLGGGAVADPSGGAGDSGRLLSRGDRGGRGDQGGVSDSLTEAIIGACIEVHRHLGPGLLESAYEQCLCYELGLRGLAFERQRSVPLRYKGVRLDCGYRADVVVEESDRKSTRLNSSHLG